MANLVRNYSPHIDAHSAPPTTELRKILGTVAREMLEKFLCKWRDKRESGGVQVVDEVCYLA
jgi:hypothetical protein